MTPFHRIRAAAGVALAAACLAPAFAQQPSPTRGVVVFTELETDLARAVHDGDHARVDRLLAPDFEQRDAARVETPEPRAEWLAAQAGAPVASASGMAVHDYGDIAVASFHADSGTTQAAVVDVWRRQGNGWQLQLRFTAPAGANAPRDAGKPDGKG